MASNVLLWIISTADFKIIDFFSILRCARQSSLVPPRIFMFMGIWLLAKQKLSLQRTQMGGQFQRTHIQSVFQDRPCTVRHRITLHFLWSFPDANVKQSHRPLFNGRRPSVSFKPLAAYVRVTISFTVWKSALGCIIPYRGIQLKRVYV